MGLSVLWTKQFKDESKKEDFVTILKNSRIVLGRLDEILDEMTDQLEAEQMDFSDPNWPYKQAALVAQKHTLKKIRKLINIS